MTFTDLDQPRTTPRARCQRPVTPEPIGSSLADLTRLTSAFAHFLAAHPDLPDLHAVTVEYNSASVSWALDLLTADFDAEGWAAVDAWGKALGTCGCTGFNPGTGCDTYDAESTLIGFPIRVWSTYLAAPEPNR